MPPPVAASSSLSARVSLSCAGSIVGFAALAGFFSRLIGCLPWHPRMPRRIGRRSGGSVQATSAEQRRPSRGAPPPVPAALEHVAHVGGSGNDAGVRIEQRLRLPGRVRSGFEFLSV